MSKSPQLEDKLKDLLVFHNVARALTSTLELDEVLRAILEQMQPFFQPESWALLMLDEPKKELYYVIAAGQATEELKNVRVPVGEGMAGWVAATGETLIVPRMDDDPRFRQERNNRFRIQSAISLPLRSRRHTLGVIQLFNSNLNGLTDYTISFLHILCDYAAIAIENARAVKRIHELTITDDCTGLFNVRHLQRVLESEVERSLRFQKSFSLIFIDLDRFKSVNDKHGHLVGSRLLSEVGGWFDRNTREIDICFRYGGDEFIILMPETPKQDGIAFCMQLRDQLRNHVFEMGPDLHLKISASFGIAAFPDDGVDVQRIISAADDAMYNVKAEGRDGVAIAGAILPTAIPSE